MTKTTSFTVFSGYRRCNAAMRRAVIRAASTDQPNRSPGPDDQLLLEKAVDGQGATLIVAAPPYIPQEHR